MLTFDIKATKRFMRLRDVSWHISVSLVSIVVLVGSAYAKSAVQGNEIVVHFDKQGATINPDIHGQFVEHVSTGVYDGLWVGPESPIPNTRGFRNDVVEALRRLHVPVIRWPGGCFADSYDWRDGIGPITSRPVRANPLWGITESNAVGTHEFMDLADQLGAKTYVNINMGTATAGEMRDWLDYMTSPQGTTLSALRAANGHKEPFHLSYLGLGNESWGCGGQMTPETYDSLVRQFSTFVRLPKDQKVQKVAVGPDFDNYRWTETIMKSSGTYRLFGEIPAIDAISLHYYVLPGGSFKNKGKSFGFDESLWFGAIFQTLRLDGVISKHSEIMDRYDPAKRVALVVDEWGAWHDSVTGNFVDLRQENTLRDAMVAATGLLIFQKHADRVRMANIAQMVNVLQAMVVTHGDKIVLTPTYHVFDMFKDFQNATQLSTEVRAGRYHFGKQSVPSAVAGAARTTDGRVKIAVVNFDPRDSQNFNIKIDAFRAEKVEAEILTGPAMDSANDLDNQNRVSVTPFSISNPNLDAVSFTAPSKSIVVLTIYPK